MLKTRIMKLAVIAFLFLPVNTFAQTPDIKEYKVVKGDTLWDISKTELNDPFLWSKVWKENSGIANPNKIYPDQMIRIPLYLIQKEKREAFAAPQSASVSASQESAIAEKQRNKGIVREVAPQPASASQESAIVADHRYKGIKGVILYDGSVIEGQIIRLNADTVKIRTRDEKVMSYSFEKEIENFIKE